MSGTPHTLADRRAAVTAAMADAGYAALLVASNGFHMIDVPNPVAHLTDFRSVGPCLVMLDQTGGMRAVAAPIDDAERLQGYPFAATAAGDEIGVLLAALTLADHGPMASVGLDALPRRLAARVEERFGPLPAFDKTFTAVTGRKTDAEIERARAAVRIAESGYAHLQAIAHVGMRECDLAVAVNLHMKTLGANDSFLMLNAGPRSDAVMPSSERVLEPGDLILVELSPAVEGQFVQICRTLSLGPAAPLVHERYGLLTQAMMAGIARVRPGAHVGEACAAIDTLLSEAGFAQFSRPPFIRRRGHGLGGGSTAPGDVGIDNATVLEPGMVFIVHPNQFLPDAGYMMCGETVCVTQDGFEILSRDTAALATIPLRLLPSC